MGFWAEIDGSAVKSTVISKGLLPIIWNFLAERATSILSKAIKREILGILIFKKKLSKQS